MSKFDPKKSGHNAPDDSSDDMDDKTVVSREVPNFKVADDDSALDDAFDAHTVINAQPLPPSTPPRAVRMRGPADDVGAGEAKNEKKPSVPAGPPANQSSAVANKAKSEPPAFTSDEDDVVVAPAGPRNLPQGAPVPPRRPHSPSVFRADELEASVIKPMPKEIAADIKKEAAASKKEEVVTAKVEVVTAKVDVAERTTAPTRARAPDGVGSPFSRDDANLHESISKPSVPPSAPASVAAPQAPAVKPVAPLPMAARLEDTAPNIPLAPPPVIAAPPVQVTVAPQPSAAVASVMNGEVSAIEEQLTNPGFENTFGRAEGYFPAHRRVPKSVMVGAGLALVAAFILWINHHSETGSADQSSTAKVETKTVEVSGNAPHVTPPPQESAAAVNAVLTKYSKAFAAAQAQAEGR